jgi:hypothetical protein
LYNIHFSLPITISFKNGTFSLYCNGELHAEIWSRRFFSLTYIELKHQSNEHNQAGTNEFWNLIWIFWICQLSPAWYNVDCSELMSQFVSYQLQLVCLTVECRPAKNLHHETSQTTFDIAFSLHIAHIFFFRCCSYIFTFLE